MKSSFPNNIAQKYISLGYWKKKTLPESLCEWAAQHKDRVALVDGSKSLSYEALEIQSKKLAYSFVNAGLKPDDRVVVQLANSNEFIIVLFALMNAGVLPILALPLHRFNEIDDIIKVSGAVGYISQSRFGGFDYNKLAKDLKKNNKTLEKIFFTTSPLTLITKLPTIVFDEIALFLLSGGTTSSPKLIPRTHTDYLYNLETMATKCGMDENSKFLAAIPVSHNFALACPGALGVLASGGTVVFEKHPDPLEILEKIDTHQITHLALVPILADLICIAANEIDEFDLSSLELVQVGGARFTAESAKRLLVSIGCNLQQVFGMAEGLLCCTLLDDDDEIKITSQGRPISPHDEILILQANGLPVKEGEVCELYTRGPYTLRAYFNAGHHNETAFTDQGFYRTGDLVKCTFEGNLIVAGRVKELINRGGEKFSPLDVENHLIQHDHIMENILVSVPDDTLGERTILFVKVDNCDINRADVISFLKGKDVPAYKYPDDVVVLTQLPLTSVGKIDKLKLLENYQYSKRNSDCVNEF